jgi:NAD(P)-dependent dehydrogenase (short-subunit alcohol dehydrogenase family)
MARDAAGETRMSRRIALVTGAGDGLGRAIALDLARHGYDLAVTDLETEMLKTTVDEVAAEGARVLPVALDLRRQDSIEAALDTAAPPHLKGRYLPAPELAK